MNTQFKHQLLPCFTRTFAILFIVRNESWFFWTSKSLDLTPCPHLSNVVEPLPLKLDVICEQSLNRMRTLNNGSSCSLQSINIRDLPPNLAGQFIYPNDIASTYQSNSFETIEDTTNKVLTETPIQWRGSEAGKNSKPWRVFGIWTEA